MQPTTEITWASSEDFDAVVVDGYALTTKGRRVSMPLIVGNTVTSEIYEECLRWDYDNDCWVKAYDINDSNVEVVPDV